MLRMASACVGSTLAHPNFVHINREAAHFLNRGQEIANVAIYLGVEPGVNTGKST